MLLKYNQLNIEIFNKIIQFETMHYYILSIYTDMTVHTEREGSMFNHPAISYPRPIVMYEVSYKHITNSCLHNVGPT